MVFYTRHTNYSTGGMVIKLPSPGGVISLLSVNYLPSGGVISLLSVNYHPPGGVISLLSVNYHPFDGVISVLPEC